MPRKNITARKAIAFTTGTRYKLKLLSSLFYSCLLLNHITLEIIKRPNCAAETIYSGKHSMGEERSPEYQHEPRRSAHMEALLVFQRFQQSRLMDIAKQKAIRI